MIRRVNADFVPVSVKAQLLHQPGNEEEVRLLNLIGRSGPARQETQQRFEALQRLAQSGGGPEEIQRQAQKIRQELETKVEALLTGAQQSRWKGMIGKPLKLEPTESLVRSERSPG